MNIHSKNIKFPNRLVLEVKLLIFKQEHVKPIKMTHFEFRIIKYYKATVIFFFSNIDMPWQRNQSYMEEAKGNLKVETCSYLNGDIYRTAQQRRNWRTTVVCAEVRRSCTMSSTKNAVAVTKTQQHR